MTAADSEQDRQSLWPWAAHRRDLSRTCAALQRAAAPEAGRIVARDVCGWFERVERGLYRLTSLGEAIGMGYYARGQHELLLVAKRGDVPPPAEGERVSSVLWAERTRHSAKPVQIYELIERQYPTLPKIELFARQSRDGWDVWGNEVSASPALL